MPHVLQASNIIPTADPELLLYVCEMGDPNPHDTPDLVPDGCYVDGEIVPLTWRGGFYEIHLMWRLH